MKKIITILTFAIIAFISSDLKAQDIAGPATLTVGVPEYYFYVGSPVWVEGNPTWIIAPDAFWYTSEDPYTHRPFLNGNEMSIPTVDYIGGQLPGVVFTTTGTHYITAHYGGWSNHSAAVTIAVTVVAAP